MKPGCRSNPAIISDIDGIAEIIHDDEGDKIKITGTETFRTEYNLPKGLSMIVESGQWVDVGTILASSGTDSEKDKLPATETQPLFPESPAR